MIRVVLRCVLIAGSILVLGHPWEFAAADPQRNYADSMTVSRNGIVATSQAVASQVGASILARGGSAVDAAIAANAALGVIEPMMNGMGGDLFAIVYDAKTKKLYGLNSSGWSPKAMTIGALKAKGLSKIPPRSIYAVTVPGAVAGWAALHKRFGKLPLAEDLQPAIALAKNGVPIPETDAANWKEFGEPLASSPTFAPVFLPGGKPPTTGQVFRNPDLAHSLSIVAQHGRAGFYSGPIAHAILKLSRSKGGFLTAADLADFQPQWASPISTTYHGWTVYEMPPNSQGEAALAMLNIMEQFPLRQWGHDSAKTLHVEIEAKKLAYADLLHYVGDPRTNYVPTAQLISKKLARRRARLIQMNHAHCHVLPSVLKERLSALKSDTTYFATVDRDGDEVSIIQSNSDAFGSGLVAPGTGFVLQDRGTGFTMKPGQPDSLAPHKRPLHTIIPAFMQQGDIRIAFGIMRGFNQAQAHAQFVSDIVDFGMNIQAALDAPRFDKTTFGGCDVNIEDGFSRSVFAALTAKGHHLILNERYSQIMGRGNAVMHNSKLDVNFGATDPRADGAAVPEIPLQYSKVK
ncbi:MAG TPA: gamma-glutamyltransferase [Bryobacteraceae bacterium]